MMLFSKSFNDLPSSIQLFECSEALHLNDLRGLVFHFLLRYVCLFVFFYNLLL